tara:strand:+ start:3361 stop:3816 length:456 start_codon:yes stop_codon:yes gene_type:complete
MSNVNFKKGMVDFKKNIDFNYISELLDNANYESTFSSDWDKSYIFKSIFKINNVQDHDDFKDFYNYCEKNFNKNKSKSNLLMFFSLKSGTTSATHKDTEDVYILGVKGKTWYKVSNKEYIVEKGDLLKIPANSIHTAIGLTPRIIVSYGVW